MHNTCNVSICNYYGTKYRTIPGRGWKLQSSTLNNLTRIDSNTQPFLHGSDSEPLCYTSDCEREKQLLHKFIFVCPTNHQVSLKLQWFDNTVTSRVLIINENLHNDEIRMGGELA